jgi:sugar O-acyltransferase (sialic acid O-acetyltransferase NeuD family)
MQPIAIFGTGGLGREVHELIEDLNLDQPTYEIIGFLDGNASLHGELVHDLPVLGDASWLEGRPGVAVAMGVGNPAAKVRITREVRQNGGLIPSLIHPSAHIGRRVVIGEGTIVCAGTIATTDVTISELVTLNLDITIGHDSIIHDYVTVAPGAHISGNVNIGEGADLGTGTTIIQGVTLGEWSIIGAGASVVRDVPANVTAVGVPAKVIKEREAGWQRAGHE